MISERLAGIAERAVLVPIRPPGKPRGEKQRTWSREYEAKRRRDDPGYRILGALRARIGAAVKRGKGTKRDHTHLLVGCTLAELVEHLASQFADGMTLENYGLWHIDHIRPCASFDLTNHAQQRECFHFSNLQPLWAKDNWSKSDKLISPHNLIQGRSCLVASALESFASRTGQDIYKSDGAPMRRSPKWKRGHGVNATR